MTWGRVLLSCLLGLAISMGAEAGITDHPRFKVDGIVIVWSSDSDQIQAQSPKAAIGNAVRLDTVTTPVTTGILIPTQNPTVDLIALNERADGETSFFIASNTAFNIDAEIIASGGLRKADLENMSFRMKIDKQGTVPLAFGQKAQFPHSSGATGGLAFDITTLADLQDRKTVFTGNQRTARSSGTIVEQSVRFTALYQSEFSEQSAKLPNVVYIVFVP